MKDVKFKLVKDRGSSKKFPGCFDLAEVK